MNLETRVAARVRALAPDGPLGLAVSGGSDSTALMHLLARAGIAGLRVATVDHGLRPEAAAEAAAVARAAKALGVPHDILTWTGWDRRGNLQDAARLARQDLLRGWACRYGLAAVALGHTLDDQAETVLMRLARGSGVDGLSGMAARRLDGDLLWLRPMLDERRQTLRDWLATQAIPWIDDPSNEDPRFDRVRTRRLLAETADLGITPEGVSETAQRMAAARQVLGQVAQQAAEALVTVEAGSIRFTPGLWNLPDDTRWRLIAAALCQVSGQSYRPRLSALQAGEAATRAGRAHTVHFCLMTPDRGGLCVQPELNRLSQITAPAPGLWAGWQITGPTTPEAEIRVLGPKGLSQLTDWRSAGLPHPLALTTPGIWLGDRLIAAPILEKSNDWGAKLTWDKTLFSGLLLSH